jgi:anti-sigma regulatory factor (Ser/Thr protein kinase)
VVGREGVELKAVKCGIWTKITNGMAIGGIGWGLLLRVDSCVDYKASLDVRCHFTVVALPDFS